MAGITAKLSVKSGMNASMSRGGGGGQPGPPGYSPSASVAKVGDTATITITDKNGTTTAQVNDGTDGQDGYSPSASVSKSGDTVTITVTDKNGTTNATVKDGADGEDGATPVKGTDYWTAQDQADIVQDVVDEVGVKTQTVTGTAVTITGVANTRYMCGEVSTISITPPASGIIDVIFTSGSSVAVLTVPNTVLWSNGFDPTSLEANTTYEINILDGVYGAVMTWT